MKRLFTSLLFLFVASCSILPKPKPTAVHDLGNPYLYSPSSTISAQTQQPTVTVEAPTWLEDNRIHYRLLYHSPTEVRFYALDRWIAPPPDLFGQLLNSSDINWVAPTIVRLHVFEQQFVSPTQAKAVMHFTVTKVPGDNNHKPVRRDFHFQTPCPSADAKGAVTGLTVLAKQARDAIESWLMETN
jgi:cholesterol transport system auxiliary component